MARAARRYDIYLPLTFNNGDPIPKRYFIDVEQKLLGYFGGATALQRKFPFRGLWQSNERIYVDRVIVLSALDFRKAGSARFIAELKSDLLRRFDQLEILITETSLRVH